MKKEVIVISLGGSIIIPAEVNVKFLKKFKKTIIQNTKKYKFVIVCGGGSIARKYINALKDKSHELQSYAGISATRMNARFMSYFFDFDQKEIPHTIETVKEKLKAQSIVFCGALGYKKEQTSDSTSAQVAEELNAKFINITNVDGLYSKDPKKYKDAKLIKNISKKDFNILAKKIQFKPGQHFVLDQKASQIILDKNIPTYIINASAKQLDYLLKNKKFTGTTIQ
jgi:uridylate kinase